MVALALLGSAATILFALNLSQFIAGVFLEGQDLASASVCLYGSAFAGLLKAATIWLQEVISARAAISSKQELRAKFFKSIARLGPAWLAKRDSAKLTILATSGLNALDAYFAKYLPQLIFTVLVTPIFTVIIFVQDAGSGWALLATIPLIPIFMVMIGWATRAVQQKQLDALFRLSSHFLQLLRGLTTLRIFGRTEAQSANMARVAEDYRKRTMRVLRVSFLSGFALELLGSLSVALIAVSIGLRLVNGELTLAVGLFVLLLAPEAYLPLRMVGANFHAAAEGVTIAKEILDIIDEQPAAAQDGGAKNLVALAQPGQVTLLRGPSGAGKTTQLRTWLGFDREGVGLSENLEETSWVPQAPSLFAGTVAQNIVGFTGTASPDRMRQAIELAALDDVAPEAQVGVSGSSLSGGQQQRVALARAFYRALADDCETLILDEPVSALDAKRAAVVAASITGFARKGLRVVVISHQIDLLSFDRKIEVNAHG